MAPQCIFVIFTRWLPIGLLFSMRIACIEYSITHAGLIRCGRSCSFDWEAGLASRMRLYFGVLESIRRREWLLAVGQRLTITFDHRLR